MAAAVRLTLLIAIAAAVAMAFVVTASAHRSRCHQAHECPSDHGTYPWRGLRCVYKTADERTASYKRRVVYGGRVYFCKRWA